MCREEDDEKLTLQLDEMKDRIASDQERSATLKRKVQLDDLLKDHVRKPSVLYVRYCRVELWRMHFHLI